MLVSHLDACRLARLAGPADAPSRRLALGLIARTPTFELAPVYWSDGIESASRLGRRQPSRRAKLSRPSAFEYSSWRGDPHPSTSSQAVRDRGCMYM